MPEYEYINSSDIIITIVQFMKKTSESTYEVSFGHVSVVFWTESL